jgi:hypothetical protein
MSKGGTTSGSTEIPAWLENAAIENINKARDVSQIGYVPYYGPDVAAFSPMQQQSMQSTGNAASAFGLAPQGFNAMAGMPQAETFAGGLQGYSSAPLYEQSLDNLFANAPGQYRAMNDMFIDPFTGSAPRSGYGATPIQTGQMISGGGDNGRSPYGNDANIDHLNRMKEQGTADVYDSIYRQNKSSDLVGGDTFVGDDGLNYTVGYDVGQVDPALANAVQRNKINEVRSTGSAIGSMIGNTLQDGLLGRVFEGVTGVAPFNSNDAPIGSLSNADVNDGRFANIIGYEQENARAQSDAALRQQIDAYSQRGDMYPSQIEGGLLNGTPLASNNIVDLSAARQAEDLAAQQRAAQRVAEERAQSALAVQYANEQAAAAQRMAAEKAAQLAHEQAMIAAQRSTVNSGGGGNPNKGNNSSGGYGKSKAPGEAGSRFGL